MLRGWEGYEKTIFVVCLPFWVFPFKHLVVNVFDIIEGDVELIGHVFTQHIHVSVIGHIENSIWNTRIQTGFGKDAINYV